MHAHTIALFVFSTAMPFSCLVFDAVVFHAVVFDAVVFDAVVFDAVVVVLYSEFCFSIDFFLNCTHLMHACMHGYAHHVFSAVVFTIVVFPICVLSYKVYSLSFSFVHSICLRYPCLQFEKNVNGENDINENDTCHLYMAKGRLERKTYCKN